MGLGGSKAAKVKGPAADADDDKCNDVDAVDHDKVVVEETVDKQVVRETESRPKVQFADGKSRGAALRYQTP